MPVPQTWADIFPNPALNSPAGSEPIGTLADDYIRQAYAFCKQLHDGWLAADGSIQWTGNQNANGRRLTNLAAPTNATDAATKQYADNLIAANFPRGTIIMWWGNRGDVPAGWLVCDGQNGTPDMRDRFPIGAGLSFNQGAYAGNNSPVISQAQMPAHSHGVNDPGHGHGVYDPGHNHSVNDPGHSHNGQYGGWLVGPYQGQGTINANLGNVSSGWSAVYQNTSHTGSNIGINGAGSNIGIYGSGTGIWLSNTGGNAAFDNRPAFTSLWFIMKQ